MIQYNRKTMIEKLQQLIQDNLVEGLTVTLSKREDGQIDLEVKGETKSTKAVLKEHCSDMEEDEEEALAKGLATRYNYGKRTNQL